MMKRRSFKKTMKRRGSAPKMKYRKALVLQIPVLGYNNPTSQTGWKWVRRTFTKTGKVVDVVYDELPDRVRVITTFPR